MKKVILSVLIVFSTQLFAQNIPCSFTWENAPTTNGNRNFITPIKNQPYQGPCLAFAFNAAIESKYAIENNIDNPTVNLSEAYLDYKVWNAPNYISDLNSGFKIPLKNMEPEINVFAPSTCPVNNPNPGECGTNNCSIRRSELLNYIENPNGQKSYKIFFNTNLEPPKWSVADGGSLGNYVTVGNTIKLDRNDINSIEDIKLKILNSGPLVLKVSGSQNGDITPIQNAKKFRASYIAPNCNKLSYHAFTIIGWTDDSRWIIKDSWSGLAGIVTTEKNVGILNLMSSGSVELYEVSNISYNGNTPSTNVAILSLSDCNSPIVNLQLSPINLEIDYIHLGGYLYHKFWVTSNSPVDRWVWGIAYPNGAIKRSQTDGTNLSSLLMTPTTSGLVTIYVRAYKNNQTITKEKVIYLFNGKQSLRIDNGW